jgi:hypothetical protein
MATGHFAETYVSSSQWIRERPDLIEKAVAAVAVEHLGTTEWEDDPGTMIYHPTDETEMNFGFCPSKKLADVMLDSLKGTAAGRVAVVDPASTHMLSIGNAVYHAGVPTISYMSFMNYMQAIPRTATSTSSNRFECTAKYWKWRGLSTGSIRQTRRSFARTFRRKAVPCWTWGGGGNLAECERTEHQVAHPSRATCRASPIHPAVKRAAWFEQFGTAGRYRLVTEGDGVVNGYAGTVRFRPKAAYETTVEWTIYCAPEAEGRGMGRKLYAAL